MTKNTVWGNRLWSREIGQRGFFSVLKVGDGALMLKTLIFLYLAASSDAGVRRAALSMIEIKSHSDFST